MFEHRWAKGFLILFTLFFFAVVVFEIDALARVGGGRSFGSRGSRSYSAPRTVTPSPAQPSPSRQYTEPARTPMSQPMAQPQGGFLRGLAGGIIGGMIGGMLFRSLGFAGGTGGMGGGIGLMDIVLIVILRQLLVRQETAEAASGAFPRRRPTLLSSRLPILRWAQGDAWKRDWAISADGSAL